MGNNPLPRRFDKTIASLWIDRRLLLLAKRVAGSRGITISEYLRGLLLRDLERLGLLKPEIEDVPEATA